MYSLTLEKKENIPIAIIKSDDDLNEKIVYIQEENDSILKKRMHKDLITKKTAYDYEDIFDDYYDDIRERNKAIKTVDSMLLTKNYKSKDRIIQEIFNIIYNEINKFSPTKEIELEDGKFQIYPNPKTDEFELLYIYGRSGSGKSTVAYNYALLYHELFPKNDIYLISSMKEDKTLDNLKSLNNFYRLKIETIQSNFPKIEEFNDSLIIADDFETLESSDKNLFKSIISLLKLIATQGRHSRTRLLTLFHLPTNYTHTRTILEEATKIVIYPSSAPNKSLQLLLGKYGSLDNKQIEEVKNLKSRWVCIHKNNPAYYISEFSIKLLTN